MSKTPFMPLWVADFLADTLDLDSKEIGAYMLILMTMWQRGGTLPRDPKKLQRVARVGRDWPKVWAAIEHYFDGDETSIWNARLRDEIDRVRAKSEAAAQAGARGGKAKALKSKDQGLADASDPPKHLEPYRDDDDARGGESTHREHLLSEMGADPVSGLTGPTGKRIGTRSDMAHVEKWAAAGVSEKDQIAIVREVMARKRDGPPSSFGYFDRAMSDFAANRDRPLPSPRNPSQQSGETELDRWKRLAGA
jgi:uncharacterized protein YdaU (DUF1376 family)